MRVFVAYAFGDPNARSLIEGCPATLTQLPDGRPIDWRIFGVTLDAVGWLWSHIEGEIRRADRVLAVLGPSPNANVMWEIGYAFGLGKPVDVVARGGARPAWIDTGPLEGLTVSAIADPVQLSKRLAGPGFRVGLVLTGSAADADRCRVYAMCPSGVFGGHVRQLLGRRAKELRLRLAPEAGDRLVPRPGQDGLQLELPGDVRALWVVALNDPPTEDGPDNAKNALVAGLLAAHGRPLGIVRHGDQRTMADVAGIEERVSGVGPGGREVDSAIDRIVAQWGEPERLPPIAVPAGAGAQIVLIRKLASLGWDLAKVRREAWSRDLVLTQRDSGLADDAVWAEVIRQLGNFGGNLRPVLEAGRREASGDPFWEDALVEWAPADSDGSPDPTNAGG